MTHNVLLFDLDGTLTDSALGITNSFIYTFNYYHMPVPDQKVIRTFIGPSLVTTFSQTFGFSSDKTGEAIAKYREYYEAKGLFENSVYTGIDNLLAELHGAGKLLMVATSKPEQLSRRILDHFNLTRYFAYICGSNMDETRSKKSEVITYALETAGISDKQRVLMIGDRKYDILGAHECGIQACGVLWGCGSREELEEAGADYLVGSVAELGRMMEKEDKK